MKAVVYTGLRQIDVKEREIPEISEEELLIKVRAAAICGTDLRIYRFGNSKIPNGVERVLGHEVAGEIVKVGSKVSEWKAGDRVAIPPNIGCGKCELCLKGYYQLCKNTQSIGISMDGGFQEYMRVPKEAVSHGGLIRIPDQLSYEEAVVVEPFSCTYHCYKGLDTKPGQTVLIIGSGPIGACHVMINKLAGAGKVIVADIAKERLEQIQAFGADEVIDSSAVDLKERVMELTQGKGVDIVITACSVPEIQTQALELAAIHGKINFFGGMPAGKEEVKLITNYIHYKELTVMGTTGSTALDYIESMKIAASKRLPLDQLVSARYKFEEAKEAFQYALDGKGMKCIFVNND